MKIKGLLFSIGLNSAACYAVVNENQVILNSYAAFSIIFFAYLFLILILLNTERLKNTPEIRKLIKSISQIEEIPKIVKNIYTMSDIALLFFLFGYGHWILGFLWLCIHFIFDISIKETIKNHKIKK